LRQAECASTRDIFALSTSRAERRRENHLG
jgi:hypothetical protein